MIPKKRAYDRNAPRNRQCKVCAHPERVRMESLMASGASRESVARKFNISPHSVWRHMRRHVHAEDLEILKGGPAQLAKMAESAAAENMSLMDYLAILRSRLMRQLEASSAANDNVGVCRTSQVLLSVLQELGRLTGEIDRIAGIVINNNSNNQTLVQMTDPLIAKLQAGLLRALAPFPEARNAVIRLLSELEASEPAPSLPRPVADLELTANGQ